MSQEQLPQELPPTKLTILISGNGSNLQAIIDATATVLRNVSIVRVISDRKNAYGLKRAEKAAIPTTYHNMLAGKYVAAKETDPEKKLKGRRAFDADLAEIVLKDSPDLIVCAGFMHILTPEFLTPLAGKDVPVINLHPALPGEYDGIRAIERAYEDNQNGKINRTGVMMHYVIQEVDAGTPLLIREVEFTKGEKLEDFEERLHKVEHTIIVEGTQKAMKELWENRAKRTAA